MKAKDINKIIINPSPYSLTHRLKIRDTKLNSFKGKFEKSKIRDLLSLFHKINNMFLKHGQKLDLFRLALIGIYLDFMKIKKRIKNIKRLK
jgi:hypothetical protein